MKKRLMASAVVMAVLLFAYAWSRLGLPEKTGPVVEVPAPVADATAPRHEVVPGTLPALDDAIGSASVQSNPAAPEHPRPSPAPYGGTATKVASLEFSRSFFVFNRAGVAVRDHDEPMLTELRRKYGLDDEEFRAFVQHSQATLRSNGQYVEKGMEKLCARQAEFRDLQSLSMALDEFERDFEMQQERLGRDAETALGPAIVWKIDNQLLREPPQEIPVPDNITRLAAYPGGLDQLIRRFCPSR